MGYKRPTKLQKEYAVDMWSNMKPISELQLDWCLKQSAVYIYTDHDNSGWCTKCETKVRLPKTKHMQDIKCPNCGQTMKVLHVWRRKGANGYWGLENGAVNWYVFPQALNDHQLMLRYVVVSKENTEPAYGERARMILDFEKEREYYLEYDVHHKTWDYGTHDYFREHNMSYWDTRRWCCLGAEIYPRTIRQLNKIESLKHIVFSPDLFKGHYVSGVVCWFKKRADLIEKLTKVGLQDLVKEDLNSFYGHEIHYDREQSSLVKMLRINKGSFNLLKTTPTIEALNFLQKYPSVSQQQFEDIKMFHFNTVLFSCITEHNLKYGKTVQYVKRNAEDCKLNDFARDYVDYVDALIKLGYPLDNQYLYPKDFRKDDEMIHQRLRDKEAADRRLQTLAELKREAHIDKTINKISKALRECKELRFWIGGSNGLKVVVPESVGEIVDEGIALHNCLQQSKYPRWMANKEKIIFFIRRLDDPEKAFISVEYANGKIEQIRFDNNVAVEDEKIVSFANHFAEELNRIQFMDKIRRIG